MSRSGAMRRDGNMVGQRPAWTRAAIPVCETPTACAGAAASYVLRRVAYRAGSLAPGIDEELFHELHEARHGAALDDVVRWFDRRGPALQELGYRLHVRRLARPTRELFSWIDGGRGHRGAVLATRYEILHPPAAAREGVGDTIVHAVGLAVEGRHEDGEREFVMIDPWSRTGDTSGRVRPGLERAHRDREHDTLAVYWSGWA